MRRPVAFVIKIKMWKWRNVPHINYTSKHLEVTGHCFGRHRQRHRYVNLTYPSFHLLPSNVSVSQRHMGAANIEHCGITVLQSFKNDYNKQDWLI